MKKNTESRILKPNNNTLKGDTNKLNKYFNETVTKLASRKSMNKKELTTLTDSFNDKENSLQLQPVVYKNDCSTGYDYITASFIKLVSEFLVLANKFYYKELHQSKSIPRHMERH